MVIPRKLDRDWDYSGEQDIQTHSQLPILLGETKKSILIRRNNDKHCNLRIHIEGTDSPSLGSVQCLEGLLWR